MLNGLKELCQHVILSTDMHWRIMPPQSSQLKHQYPIVLPLSDGRTTHSWWTRGTDEALKIAVSFLVSRVFCFIIPVFLDFLPSLFALPFPAPQSHPHRYSSVNPVLCNNSEDHIP
jgi:hypothetical protein